MRFIYININIIIIIIIIIITIIIIIIIIIIIRYSVFIVFLCGISSEDIRDLKQGRGRRQWKRL